MVYIAVFASGGGSNAREICRHFENHATVQVGLVVTNNPKAGVVKVAEEYNIPSLILTGKQLNDSGFLTELLDKYSIAYIILAGYLKLIPVWLLDKYPDRIMNIHPSLLPKYGGKGMYGMHVHEAVKANGDAESGMTVHLVNNEFDKGRILFQKKIVITQEMSAEEIAAAVLNLEHANYSKTIEKFISGY